MQDLRLVFKRDVDAFVAKDVCQIPFDAKNEFILSYHRALGTLHARSYLSFYHPMMYLITPSLPQLNLSVLIMVAVEKQRVNS